VSKRLYGRKGPKKSGKFSPGDRVRLSKAKRTFKKGYLPNWTEELFTVVKCIDTRPPVYLVKDDHGEIMEGTFYAEEIQKVIKQDDVYKIQSVLKINDGKEVWSKVARISRVLQQLDLFVNADYDNRLQDEYLTQKYDLPSRYLFYKADPRRCAVRVTRCHLQN
jgi:hypothetical protein